MKIQKNKIFKRKKKRVGWFHSGEVFFCVPIKTPQLIYLKFMKSTGDKEMSTTMALVRMLTNLLRDKNVAPKLVPIIPDEARTFGMEGFF